MDTFKPKTKNKKVPKQNRCDSCNKLLGVGDPGNIVIKCPRCGKLNRLKGSGDGKAKGMMGSKIILIRNKD